MNSFYPTSLCRRHVGGESILVLAFILCILFVSRHKQTASIQLQKQICWTKIAYKATKTRREEFLKAIRIKQFSN